MSVCSRTDSCRGCMHVGLLGVVTSGSSSRVVEHELDGGMGEGFKHSLTARARAVGNRYRPRGRLALGKKSGL